MSSIIFLTHPEVVIDPAQPIPEWPLYGDRARAAWSASPSMLADRDVSAVYASRERKAMDGAEIVAERFGLSYRDRRGSRRERPLVDRLHRAAGILGRGARVLRPSDTEHARLGARHRRAGAHRECRRAGSLREDETSGDIVIVSHGGVGCLLTAHLQKVTIGRESRPSHPGGGCFIIIDRDTFALTQDWRAIEDGFAS